MTTFRESLRAGIEKAYEGILSQEAIDGCVQWWTEVVEKIRAEALEEAIAVTLETEIPVELVDQHGKVKLLAFEYANKISNGIRKLKEGACSTK